MRVIIAGGGTGGHIFPAISIADEIKNRSENNEILFVGTKNGLEKDIIPKNGYKIRFIHSKGIIGKGMFDKLRAISSIFFSIFSSFKIIRDFKPDVVVGVGGYVSGPTMISAYLSFIPTAICEQNYIPGFTNKVLSNFVKKIFVSFGDGKQFFPEKKVVVTGNPVRKNFDMKTYVNSDKNQSSLNIFVLGGSQGATKLNEVVPEAIKKINLKKINVVHQAGKKDESAVAKKYSQLGITAQVYSFIENIQQIYRDSDLIISRAGASTISELAVIGKPSILIPFPYATHDHQLFNAKFMENNGASLVLEEKDLSADTLSQKIEKIITDNKLQQMSEASKKLGKPDAAKHIVDELYLLVKE